MTELKEFWEAAMLCRDTGGDQIYWNEDWECEATLRANPPGSEIGYVSSAMVNGYYEHIGHIIFAEDWPDYFEEEED